MAIAAPLYKGTGLTFDELRKLGQGAAGFKAGLNTAAPQMPNSSIKTEGQYVPLISANPSPNGGNTTEYRAPRAGDTGIGVSAPPAPQVQTVQTQQAAVPAVPNDGLYKDPYARTPDSITALAKSRIDAILQAGRTSAQGSLTSARNANDYTNQIKGDSRVLRDSTFKETNNPFSGNTGYLAANTLRNDSIQDTSQNKDYNANVAQIQQKLSDLETAAPGQEQQIIDDLQQMERQYGISVAQLQEQQKNNQFNQMDSNRNYDRSISNDQYAQDPNNPSNVGQQLNNTGQTMQNQLTQMKLDSYPAESKSAAEAVQQQLKLGQLDIDTAKYKLDELKNPNSITSQIAKMDLAMKTIDMSTYSQENKLKIQQLQKTIAQIGVVHRQPQSDNDVAMDQIKLDTATETLRQLKEGKPSATKDYSKDITRIADLYITPAQFGAPPKINNPEAMRSAIISLDMDDSETDRYLTIYGLPIN